MDITLLASTIARSTKQGESHGGLFLIRPFESKYCKILDWTEENIKWGGSGGERGLRGICFYKDYLLVATNNFIIVFDEDLNEVRRICGPLLNLCHEICVGEDQLFISSTGYDLIVSYDLEQNKFSRCAKFYGSPTRSERYEIEDTKSFIRQNEFHINSVYYMDKKVYAATGTKGDVFILSSGLDFINSFQSDASLRLDRLQLPDSHRGFFGRKVIAHNVYPFMEGFLLNYTENHSIVYFKDGRADWLVQHPSCPPHHGVTPDLMSHGWARGLCFTDRFAFSGSFPASVLTVDLNEKAPVGKMFLSDYMGHSVHGLEIVPPHSKFLKLWNVND